MFSTSLKFKDFILRMSLISNFCKIYIYILCLSWCLFVCLYPINKNGWTDRAQIFVEPNMTQGKVYRWSNFQKFASIKIRFSLNFLTFLKSMKLWNPQTVLFLFYDVYKEKMFSSEIDNSLKKIIFIRKFCVFKKILMNNSTINLQKLVSVKSCVLNLPLSFLFISLIKLIIIYH